MPRTAFDQFTATTVEICPHPLLGRFADPLTGSSAVPGDQEGRPDPLVMSAVIDIVDRHGRAKGADLLGINMFVPTSSGRTALTELDLAGFERGRPRPLRVLSTQYTDDVDFRENRVAAQLVDRLDQYLGRRMAGMRVLALGLAHLDEYNRALTRRQSWRKLERTANLVAAVLDDHRASSAAIGQSSYQLSRLQTRLRLLWGSPALREANRVGELWEAWALHEADQQPVRPRP